jgi:eukaryotic-like serine/threonine-protein kinase
VTTEKKTLTEEGTIVGTFQYMAPDNSKGARSTGEPDIFALGAVLYEMATARRAFPARGPCRGMSARMDNPSSRPRNAVPSRCASP